MSWPVEMLAASFIVKPNQPTKQTNNQTNNQQIYTKALLI